MSLRSKTRRRLLVLVITALVIGVIGGAGAVIRLSYLRRSALRGRENGLAAFAQGDYPVALVQLGRYLSRYPNDADVLLSYAQARQHVEEPEGHNLGQAISLFQRVLELRPGLAEAQRDLLDLYIQVGFNTEAIALADKIAGISPGNANDATAEVTHALRCKLTAQLRMQRLDDAQATLARLTKAAPLDLEIRILELQIMLKKETQQQVVDYANRLAIDHPNDVRFDLLKSIAATLTGNANDAANLARPLATGPLVDSVYARLLVKQLDDVQLFDLSFSVIQRAARENPSRDMQRLWVRRLFETSQYPELVAQTDALDPAAASTDIEALAMRALALAHLDRTAEASSVVAALEKRGQTEPTASRWAAALQVSALHQSPDPVKTIAVLRNALIASPNNPILLQELGDAYSEAGSRDKAMSTWRQVTRISPEWNVPLVRISRAFLMAGQSADALAAAQAAKLRAAHDHDALACMVSASAANLPDGPSPDADKVLSMIADMQAQFPDDTELLSVRAGMLVRVHQHDAAVDVIRSALTSKAVLPEKALLALAQTSVAFGLHQEEACWTVSQNAYGLTPGLALARACWLRDHQRGPEALALLQTGRAAHDANDLAWQRIWAEYLDISADPRAREQWIALGDGNPNDVKLQWSAVAARSVQADHDFIGRTIDRLVSLLGADGLDLQLLRARWYLYGNANDSDATQAAILLGNVTRTAPDMIAARLLLASCYMKLGNTKGAIDQLVAASDAQPDLPGLSIDVARLLYAEGDLSRSKQYIERACRSRRVTVQIIDQAATLLALQGDSPSALSLLEKFYANEKQLPPDQVLASLYRQSNQPLKVSEICRRLLEKPDASSVAFAADFYMSQGRSDDAKSALALLDGLKLQPGAKETILANYTARYGTPDDALKYYQAAAKLAPHEAMIWQQFISYCFSSGKIDEGLAAADEAWANLDHAAGFDVLRQNRTLIKDAAKLAEARPLLIALTGNAATDAPILEAMRDVVSAIQHPDQARDIAAKLRHLADDNPRVLALQTVTLDFYIDSGQINEAIRMSTRMAQSFPNATEPLRLETNLLGTAQRWDEVLNAAKEWKRRDSGQPLDADLAIADAELKLGNPSAVTQQLDPYLDRAVKDPDRYTGVLLLRARGLLASHQPDQVETLLGPLLATSARLRRIWVSLAVGGVDDSQRAETWLERVAAVTPDDVTEKVALANAWVALGKKWNNANYQQTGRTFLSDLAKPQDTPVFALLSWGSACEGIPDWAGARSAYQRVLQREPANPIALNNLASVLVKSGGDLEQAQQLADKALSPYPKSPEFLDTEAMVQSARKNYSGAIASLKEAQQLDPQNFKWRVNLLAVLTDSGQLQDAKLEMQQITALLPTYVNVPAELHQRYESICAKLQ